MRLKSRSDPPHKARRSIYSQLLLVIAASLLLALMFAGVALYQQALQNEQRSLLEELQFSGELLANRTVAALLFNDHAAVQANIRSARFIPSVTRLCAYDQSRNNIAGYVRQLEGATCEPGLDLRLIEQQNSIDQHQAWAVLPVEDGGQTLGYLKVTATTDLIRSKVGNTLLAVMVILTGAMLLAFGLGASMLRRTLQPLKALGKDVGYIAANPFSGYRPKKFYNDEVGDLVDVFNQMLEELAKENTALQQSERRFRTLADNSPVGIYLKDSQARLQYANDKWSEITGLDPGRAEVDLSRSIAEVDWPRYRNMLQGVIKNQRPDKLEYTYQLPGSNQPKMLLEYVAPVVQFDTEKNRSETVAVIGSVLDVSELKHAQMELERLAFYDPLTNLPNRRFFRDHLHYQIAAASKSRQSLAVLMIDLDDFKRINDSMGHDAGDYLLSVLGQRLQECCFAEDVVSRLGGDEFIVLLNSASNIVIDKVSERIREAINTPVQFQSRLIETRCSVGVARYPADADNARDLMKNADIALYQAKATGRNCVVYFSSELSHVIQEHITLELKLQEALKSNRLSLYLQPQVDAHTGKLAWSEALLRWNDEEYGFIPPAQFISVAEKSGLIVEVGEWVLQETCRLWSVYGRRLLNAGIQGISVNLSPRQFYANNLVENTLGTLKEFGVPTRHVAFEITESLVMENIEQAMSTMRRLRSEGFQLSIDDFGTGYSSLAYLKQFTIDYLKIDKSFVDGLPDDQNDMAITGAIIAMARQLGVGIVAEGIETEQQVQMLAKSGCDLMQGYYFCRPLPVEELLQNLALSEKERKLINH